jgi:ADP-ribose pyrophosphatase
VGVLREAGCPRLKPAAAGTVLARHRAYVSPWLEVVEKRVDLGPPRGIEDFYSVRTSEYVVVLAVSRDGRVPLVRQYRPAIEELVLELPSGTVETGEEPADAARRELLEETGFVARELIPLGWVYVDSGRMETREWAFFALDAEATAAKRPETDEQLELVIKSLEELRELVRTGGFRMALHVAVLQLAEVHGLLS